MRSILGPALGLLLAALPLASAGTPEAPELADAVGDCSIAYGQEYLDIVAAWIDTEDADSFDVHLRLATWRAEVAEGSGYTVQFAHQGVSWGIVATYSSVVGSGWSFSTGVATAELAEGFEEAPGAFDPATATITVTFAKDLFPHNDPNDTTLRDFVAMSADLRPAYPYFVGEGAGAPVESNGKWVVCDDAVGTGTYAFGAGAHSAHAAGTAPAAETSAPAPTTEGPAATASPPGAPAGGNDTPLAPLVALAALALAALRRR